MVRVGYSGASRQCLFGARYGGAVPDLRNEQRDLQNAGGYPLTPNPLAVVNSGGTGRRPDPEPMPG